MPAIARKGNVLHFRPTRWACNFISDIFIEICGTSNPAIISFPIDPIWCVPYHAPTIKVTGAYHPGIIKLECTTVIASPPANQCGIQTAVSPIIAFIAQIGIVINRIIVINSINIDAIGLLSIIRDIESIADTVPNSLIPTCTKAIVVISYQADK